MVRTTPATWPGVFPGEDPSKPSNYFWFEVGDRNIPLPRGEVIMGRSRTCQILVDDMLVSRQHARLFVSSDSVFIEDYDSSNGIIVNEKVILGATRIHDGDRIILGTQEFVMRATPAPAIPDDLPSPPPAPQQRRPLTPEQASINNLPTRPAPALAIVDMQDDDEEPTLLTEKQDALSTMARLADRMMSLGRHEAAAKLLTDHLRGILAKLKEGKTVSREVLDIMGTYGMKLADVTRDGSWANVAVESHLIARRPLPAKAVALLESQGTRLPLFDRSLLLSYKTVLRDVTPVLNHEERKLADRIAKIPTR